MEPSTPTRREGPIVEDPHAWPGPLAMASLTPTLPRAASLVCEAARRLVDADHSRVLSRHAGRVALLAAAGHDRNTDGAASDREQAEWISLKAPEPTGLTGEVTIPGADELPEPGSALVVSLTSRAGVARQLQLFWRAPGASGADEARVLQCAVPLFQAALDQAGELDALASARVIFEMAPIGILRATPDGHMLDANPAMEAMLGYSAAELACMRFADYTHPDDLGANLELFREMMAGERDCYQIEKRCRRKDGELIWTQNTAALLRDGAGRPISTVSMIEDITRRKHGEEQLRRQGELERHRALHDPLTGIGNVRLFRDRLAQAILAVRQAGAGAAIAMVDLDGFKQVNDSLGHDAGDAVLKEVATRLAGALRESDTVARLGGDEFGLVLQRLDGSGDTAEALRRARAQLELPLIVGGRSLSITASFGVALCPEHGDDLDTLLKRADVAMYAAKRSAASVLFYDSELGSRRSAARLAQESTAPIAARD